MGERKWKVGRDLFGGTHVYDEGGDRLTNDRMSGTEDWEEQAHLIASAPDLLDALEPIVEFFVKARAGFTDGWEERMGPEHVVFGWNGEDLKLGDLQRARAAIARAQGKG